MEATPHSPKKATWAWLSLALMMTSACDGSDYLLGFDGHSGNQDGAPTNQLGGGGAGGTAPLFGNIELIEAVSSDTNQDDPSMTADRLELFFASKRDSGVGREDIYVVTRASVTDDWSEPALIGDANSVERETAIAISPDGLTLWFGSDRDGTTGLLDVWMSERSSRSDSFPAATHVPELCTEENDLPRSPNEAGTFLPLSRPNDSGDTDIFLVPLSAGPTYGTPIPLTSLNTSDGEADATLSSDALTIVFASDRDDSDGDLYLATRKSISEEFGAPIALAELNSAYEESDPWLSGDGKLILWSSRKTGQLEVYQAVRLVP